MVEGPRSQRCLRVADGLLHYFLVRRVSTHGRCNVLPRSTDLSDLLVIVLRISSLDCFYGSITYKTGKLAHSVVHGNCLLNVMGQESCQYNTIQYNPTSLIPYGKLLVCLPAGNIIHAYLYKTSNNILLYRIIAHVH